MSSAVHITQNQIKAIWTATRNQGLDEDTLRDLVENISGQRSTRALTIAQASEVLNRLTGDARPVRRGNSCNHRRYQEMDGRPDMATGAQLRKIEAMWAERSRSTDKSGALRIFLSRRFGVSDLRFLGRSRASNVIVALEKMEVI